MKYALWSIVTLILLIVALVLALPLWDSPVLRPIANEVVPIFLKVPFKIDALHLNQYLGRVIVDGLKVENPKEFKERVACSVEHFTVDVDMSTVMSEVLVVENLEIKNVFVSYVTDDKGLNNFDRILANANGGYDLRDDKQHEAYDLKQEADLKLKQAKEAAAKTEVSDKPKAAEQAKEPVKTETKKPSRKYIVDRLEVRGVLVQWGKLTMPMPPIVLTDIGRKEGGLSPDELWSVFFATFMRSLGALGVSLKDIGVDLGDLAGALSETGVENIGKGLDAIKKLDLGGKTGDAMKGTGDALKGTGDALKGTGDALKGAADSLKSLFK